MSYSLQGSSHCENSLNSEASCSSLNVVVATESQLHSSTESG